MTDTPDFDAMAREIILDVPMQGWTAFYNQGDLSYLVNHISSALSQAYEEGRLHERKIAIGEPIDLREAFGAIDE